MNNENLPTVSIKPRAGRRAKSGHPWLFSNEIAHPVPKPEAGELVALRDSEGRPMGTGFYHPNSLIAVRLLADVKGCAPASTQWFSSMLAQAAALRERLCPGRRSLRLVYGESDGLPGVVIDRYGEALCVQIHSAGAERRLDSLLEALEQTMNPACIVLRNDHDRRALEGLPSYIRTAKGDSSAIEPFDENGLLYSVDLTGGQKTGHFFDQADNRLALAPFAKGARCADIFCYSGAWALTLLNAGAASVVAVDSSADAIALFEANARLNSLQGDLQAVNDDAFAWLSRQRSENARYDLIVTDPPAFAKSAKQKAGALRGYEDINRQAIHLLEPGGVLCACSCSYFVSETEFIETLQRAARRERRLLRIVEIRGQAKDHPMLAAMPESRYLKCVIAVVAAY